MPTNDSRYYARIRRSLYEGTDSDNTKYPQALLDARPVVKTPADDEGNPAVYYTEADDGLTVKEMFEVMGVSVSYHIEGEGTNEQVTINDAYTHILAGQHAPNTLEQMIYGQMAQSVGTHPNNAMLRWGAEYDAYRNDSTLPV